MADPMKALEYLKPLNQIGIRTVNTREVEPCRQA